MNIHRVKPFEYPFTVAELNAANALWSCNCGPGALAAMVGIKLEEVRSHIPKFDERHYTNPSMMQAALKSLGVAYTEVDDGYDREGLDGSVSVMPTFPKYGLMRIQWEGPWCNPGVPIAARYKHTHWIGCIVDADYGVSFFDINCGWADVVRWWNEAGKPITSEIKRATGIWHPTHRLELAL